jgi:hypothetical protein
VLGNDLQQHRAGQVVAALRIANLELLAIHDQLAHVLQRDVTGDLGVVQTPIGIFLDDAVLCHAGSGTAGYCGAPVRRPASRSAE